MRSWNVQKIASLVRIALWAVVFVVPPLTAWSDDIISIPRIIDADTVEVSAVKVRLEAVDAPETDQLCINQRGERWACGIEARERRVARSLGMSERTLARRLSDEGLNFTEILQQLRRDLAVRYLDERKLHVSKIAWMMLGFTEVSAFMHACRRWTGKTPRQMRTAGAF